MEIDQLYEITVYTENQVGLLSSIAGMFTRRSINIEKLMTYPSRIPGVHKCRILTRTDESHARAVVLQLEKKVDVIKVYYEVDRERSATECEEVKTFLANREKNNSNR